jgi:hypothetical protein
MSSVLEEASNDNPAAFAVKIAHIVTRKGTRHPGPEKRDGVATRGYRRAPDACL